MTSLATQARLCAEVKSALEEALSEKMYPCGTFYSAMYGCVPEETGGISINIDCMDASPKLTSGGTVTVIVSTEEDGSFCCEWASGTVTSKPFWCSDRLSPLKTYTSNILSALKL